jgi:hypothetical protein
LILIWLLLLHRILIDMNKPIGNRDKRIAILLIAAFAWLFIGSLIIFHEEHVLGKHFKLTSQLFISPKSNDRQSLTVKLVKPALKLYENTGSAGIITNYCCSICLRNSFELKPKESSSFHPDDDILNYFALRAPPAV